MREDTKTSRDPEAANPEAANPEATDPDTGDTMGSPIATFKRTSPKLRRALAFGLLLLGIVAASIATYKQLSVSRESSAREMEIAQGPRVRTAVVGKSQASRALTMVGEAKPYASVTLYAKVSGYLRSVDVDKGDKVKKGDALASIESPETNRAYEGALADSHNKGSISKRMLQLRQRDLISEQESDQARSDAAVAKSKLDEIAAQKAYSILRAPFDGTVTARFADPGALVQNAANSQTSALPVLAIAQIDRLRVYVYVDQRDAAFISPGQAVTITLTERPGLELTAKVSRVSGELDAKTKMLLTEIDVDNTKGEVVAGSFVRVALTVPTPTYLQVPAEAIVVKKDLYFAPVVGSDNVVRFREVKIADTDGKMTRVLSGLQDGERVVLNPTDAVVDGSRVRPVAPEKDKEG